MSEFPTDFELEIRHVLNKHSEDNRSNTPDFILSKYIIDCLDAYNSALRRRSQWYSENPIVPESIKENRD